MPWFRRISRSRVGSWRGRRRDQGATLILLHPLRLAMSLLLVTVPAAAQRADLCAVVGPRTIRGVVVDSLGARAKEGTVLLRRWVEQDGHAILDECTAPIRRDGTFEFPNAASDSLSLVALSADSLVGNVSVHAGSEAVVVEVRLETLPIFLRTRVRDFDDFDSRPAALQDPQGIPGCYWLGHDWGGDRIIELSSDRRVDWREGDVRYDHWQWHESGRDTIVVTRIAGVFGWAGFTMDLSPPVDWSAIPALFEWKTDHAVRPNTWDSFVTRVPCPGAP